MISFDRFAELADQHNVIPITQQFVADIHTPISLYSAMRERDSFSFLFESAEQAEKIGRYSFIGAKPRIIIERSDGKTTLREGEKRTETVESVFDSLHKQSRRFSLAESDNDLAFGGGFVGYIGYESVSSLEKIPPRPRGDGEPDALLGLFETVIQFDHRTNLITVCHNVFVDPAIPLKAQFDNGLAQLGMIALRLRNVPFTSSGFSTAEETPPDPEASIQFLNSVERAKNYIRQGDIFQTVLSTKVTRTYSGDLFQVYRQLRAINPSPYLFYIDFGDTKLVGSSPEVLIRTRRGEVEVFPIAGTRKRGGNHVEDDGLEQELLSDPKERAEHVMLVDLARNDVARVSKQGTVEIPSFMRVDRFSHVMHIVSEVRGKLRAGLSGIDALKACFPAGTVSGAPKVRAMEIVRDLESHRRGAYAGAVGYIGLDGSVNTCIAIRTIVAYREVVSVQAGAGIVADSNPENEYEETVNKARVLLEALDNASSNKKRGDFVRRIHVSSGKQ